MSRVKKPKKPMFPLVATVLFAIMFSTFPPAFVAIILDSTEEPAIRDFSWIAGGVLLLIGILFYIGFVYRPYKKRLNDFHLSVDGSDLNKQEDSKECADVFYKSDGKTCCPNCGSEDLRPIFNNDRYTDGRSSIYILNTHFQCNQCRYKWLPHYKQKPFSGLCSLM